MSRYDQIDFIKTELELALTFVQIAQTSYLMGNRVDGDATRHNAVTAYRVAVELLNRVPFENPSVYKALTTLRKEVEEAIKTLVEPPDDQD